MENMHTNVRGKWVNAYSHITSFSYNQSVFFLISTMEFDSQKQCSPRLPMALI